MDFDAWIANGPGRDGQGQALQERKIQVHVEPLSLTPGEAVGDNLESLSDRIEMIEASSDRSRADCWSRVHCGESVKTFRIASRKRFSSKRGTRDGRIRSDRSRWPVCRADAYSAVHRRSR